MVDAGDAFGFVDSGRARGGGAHVDTHDVADIYERDGWDRAAGEVVGVVLDGVDQALGGVVVREHEIPVCREQRVVHRRGDGHLRDSVEPLR